MQTYSLDADKLDFADPGDPTMARRWPDEENGSQTSPPASGCTLLISSAAHLCRTSFRKSSFDEGEIINARERGKLTPHGFITAGYRLWLSNDFSVLPSLMLKIVDPAPLGINVNAKLLYRDRLWVGANYRWTTGLPGCLGFTSHRS